MQAPDTIKKKLEKIKLRVIGAVFFLMLSTAFLVTHVLIALDFEEQGLNKRYDLFMTEFQALTLSHCLYYLELTLFHRFKEDPYTKGEGSQFSRNSFERIPLLLLERLQPFMNLSCCLNSMLWLGFEKKWKLFAVISSMLYFILALSTFQDILFFPAINAALTSLKINLVKKKLRFLLLDKKGEITVLHKFLKKEQKIIQKLNCEELNCALVWKLSQKGELIFKGNDDFCGVCQSSLLNYLAVKLPDCGHQFHYTCLMKSLIAKNDCPQHLAGCTLGIQNQLFNLMRTEKAGHAV